jgi:hypothetical protein
MALRLNGQSTGYTELNAPDNGDSVVLTMPGNDGNAGQYLQTNGSGVLSWQTVSDTTGNDYNFASGSLSGASVVITGIPADAMQIVVNFDGVGWSVAGYNPIVRLGNSGGISGNGNYLWTNGFTGDSSSALWYGDGFLLNYGFTANDDRIHGSLYLSKFSGNTWKASWQGISSKYSGSSNYILLGAGSGNAGGTLDRLEILISSPSAFNTGSYNINVFTE